jgi:hypothetical protein
MAIRWKVAGLVIPALLLAACQDQPAAPHQQVPAVAADFTNNPTGGGPTMYRIEDSYWASAWYSPDMTLGAVHTTFPMSWVGWPWDDAVCGPPGLGSMHGQFDVRHWDPTSTTDPGEMHFNGMMDAWIVVLDITASGPCAGSAIIASGWGRLSYNDNNYYLTHRQQEEYSVVAEGRLSTPAGDPVNYNGHFHCVYNRTAHSGYDCRTLINIH